MCSQTRRPTCKVAFPGRLRSALRASALSLETVRRGWFASSQRLHDPYTVTERKAPLWISLRGDDTWGAGGTGGGWPAVFKMATGKPFPTMLPVPAAPRCRRVLCEAECGRHIAVIVGCGRDEQHTRALV